MLDLESWNFSISDADYKAIVKEVLENQQKLPSNYSRNLKKSIQNNIIVKGYRDSFKAHTLLLIQTIEKVSSWNNPFPFILEAWLALHEDLEKDVSRSLKSFPLPETETLADQDENTIKIWSEAVLAVLGKKEELSHRLWRGQAELVLPLIDRTRLEICKHFTSFYGSDWPVVKYKPESFQEEKSVRENLLACQLGHLAFLLKNASFISSEEPCASVISLCRWIRNKIAHSSPITFRDFEGFLHEVRKIQ